MTTWKYEHNSEKQARFVLGELGFDNLICIGINPSTATPEELDPTIRRVKSFCEANCFNGWMMINIYPQIATNPRKMDDKMNQELHQQNLAAIKQLIAEQPISHIWAAWGNNIQRRDYLFQCLKDLATIVNEVFDKKWVHLDELTNKKHPKHPLYLKKNATFREFDVHDYLKIHGY